MLYSEFELKIKKHKQMMNIYLITIADYIFAFFQCVILDTFVLTLIRDMYPSLSGLVNRSFSVNYP
jgi:hypothetical protein